MSTNAFARLSASRLAIPVRCLALLLGLLALPADAATQSLGCQIRQQDPVTKFFGQNMIENTTNKVIAAGTVIELSVLVQLIDIPFTNTSQFFTTRVTVPSPMKKGDRFSGGNSEPLQKSCKARIALVQPGGTIQNKIPSLPGTN